MPQDTESRIADYQEAFNLFDADRNGKIDSSELFRTMQKLGQSVTMDQCLAMIRDADTDCNGTIDFSEFARMMDNYLASADETTKQQELETAFTVFDVDGNGFISFTELKQVMSKLGEDLSDEELMEMMDDVDTDKDGRISFEEFKTIFSTLRGS